VPNKIGSYVGLTSRSCSAEGAQVPVQDEKEINLLKNQLAGWKVSALGRYHANVPARTEV